MHANDRLHRGFRYAITKTIATTQQAEPAEVIAQVALKFVSSRRKR